METEIDDLFNELMNMSLDEGDESVIVDLRNVPPGGEFSVNGIDFIKLGFEQGGVLCVTKDSMFTSQFHNNNDNNYNHSLIRDKIKCDFLPRLQGVKLLPFDMDLRAENGETDFGHCIDDAGLLTADLVRKYRYQLHLGNYSMWLSTPFSCMDRYPYVEFVYSSGYVSNSDVYNAFGCRPACIFAI